MTDTQTMRSNHKNAKPTRSSLYAAAPRASIRSVISSMFVGVVMLTGCSMGLTDVPDPSTIIDPSVVQTPSGAIKVYNNAVSQFNTIFAGGSATGGYSYAMASGLGGDEYSSGNQAAFALRLVGESGIRSSDALLQEQPWFAMHATRLQADQAIGALRRYAPNAPSSYLVETYAIRGYLSVMFGELFCSGVPFSRAVYGGDLVFGRSLTTTQIFEQAIADFDSALAISTDSARIRQLATMGKARALLNLGRFAEAAGMVAAIPTTYAYVIPFRAGQYPNYMNEGGLKIADRMGMNGLDYRSAGAVDPRVNGYTDWMTMAYLPNKFPTPAAGIPLADGIEARLIEAEAKLQARDSVGWATILDVLRQTATSTPLPALTADSTITASRTLRESVMFRERAFWLFGTGRRFGDIRRLVRQYNRPMGTVFPVGTHPDLYTSQKVFSSFANFAPPVSEAETNPNHSGCFNRNA